MSLELCLAIYSARARPGRLTTTAVSAGEAIEFAFDIDSASRISGFESQEVVRFHPRMALQDDRSTETIWAAGRAAMSDLAACWNGMPSHKVIDDTGMTRSFDIEISIPGPTLRPSGSGPVPNDTEDRNSISAVESRLGLRIEQRRGPVTTFGIDRIQRPSKN